MAQVSPAGARGQTWDYILLVLHWVRWNINLGKGEHAAASGALLYGTGLTPWQGAGDGADALFPWFMEAQKSHGLH